MGFVSGLLVYCVLWWIVLFAVLPWGARRPLEVQKGHDTGAPERHHLGVKAIVTTLIAALLWFVVKLLIDRRCFTFLS